MFKQLFPATLLLFALVFLTAMGVNPDGEIPVPEVNYSVIIKDHQDITTKCSNVTWNGRTNFSAKRGDGTVNIPFEKVREVSFVGSRTRVSIDAQVMLKNGEVIAITFSSEARLYGASSFGTYSISAKDIKELKFVK